MRSNLPSTFFSPHAPSLPPSDNMARGGNGKLTKLKSAIKRWPSFTKPTRTANSTSVPATDHHHEVGSAAAAGTDPNLYAVYVGKCRRRYLVSSSVVGHPLFRELVVEKSEEGEFVVACEVVLFEHLLWMLENSETQQLGSMEDLVEFYYTC